MRDTSSLHLPDRPTPQYHYCDTTDERLPAAFPRHSGACYCTTTLSIQRASPNVAVVDPVGLLADHSESRNNCECKGPAYF
jgi:hypothetical protein